MPPNVPSEYASLVESLWSKHAWERPDAENVINTIVHFSKEWAAAERRQMVQSGLDQQKSAQRSEDAGVEGSGTSGGSARRSHLERKDKGGHDHDQRPLRGGHG
mmetsp:Transcript_100757/g.288917  ORF Transcript_100757/g.288917 Transcript_100757/m.288917 type:complete len:104 (-) Transcript_100757:624-935(-)